jgi:hypothetical protein
MGGGNIAVPRQKGVSQLDTLRRKQAELAEQLRAAEAREREREKQTEARRQDILGALITEHLKSAPDSPLAKSVIELLSRKLARPADRALFPNLPPLALQQTKAETPPGDAAAGLETAQPAAALS